MIWNYKFPTVYRKRGREFNSYRKQTYGIKVKHLSQSVSESELESAFGKYGTLAGRIHLHSADTENFAFINYFSPTDAQAAANDMDGKWFDGVQIRVNVQGQTAPLSHQRNTCTVKVTNLSKHTTKNKLKDIFACHFSPKICVLSVKVNQTEGNFNYAYVNFACPNDAEQAERQLTGLEVDGNIISVRLHSSGEAAVGSPLPHGHFSPSRTVSVHPVCSPVSHGTSNLRHTLPTSPRLSLPTLPTSLCFLSHPLPPSHPPHLTLSSLPIAVRLRYLSDSRH